MEHRVESRHPCAANTGRRWLVSEESVEKAVEKVERVEWTKRYPKERQW